MQAKSKSLAKIEADFKKFMEGNITNERNKWLRSSLMSIYVRRSMRFYDLEFKECIDIANVIIPKKYQGTGVFREFMQLT